MLWTRVTKRKSEQRETTPVRRAFTSSAVQLPSRNMWTNNLEREREREREQESKRARERERETERQRESKVGLSDSGKSNVAFMLILFKKGTLMFSPN